MLRHGRRRPAASLVLSILDFVEQRGFGAYCGLKDSMAIAHLIDPSTLSCETIRVIVERTSALSLGQTVVERRENFAWDGLASIAAAYGANFEIITDGLVTACVR